MTAESTTIRRDGFDTTDPGLANSALAHLYGDVRSWVFGDPGGFTYRFRSGVTPGLAAARMRFTMGFGIEAEIEPSHHTLLVMLGGDYHRVASQYGDVVLRAGDVAVVPGGADLQVSLEALDVITFSLPVAAVARTAEELRGTDPHRFDIEDMAPMSPQAARYLWRLVGAVTDDLLSPTSALESPLVYEDTLRTLCTTFLAAFPTTITEQRQGPGEVAPRALRRAVAFIDAHADQPLTVSDVAAVARTSARAVQHAFRRHRSTTPMGYLRQVRLEHAHRELQAADPTLGDTVAAIAFRWGFAKPGHFAAAYRKTYGCNPVQTLRG